VGQSPTCQGRGNAGSPGLPGHCHAVPGESASRGGRAGSEDTRFSDYYGTIQQVVTSTANNDSGLFETNLRDERFLPFEGAGAISTWKLELPAEFRQFDYNTISDVILHMRYTARQAGGLLGHGAVAAIQEMVEDAKTSGLALLLSLPHEFPSEWAKFITAPGSTAKFEATVKRDYFPYLTQGKDITLRDVRLYAIDMANQDVTSAPVPDLVNFPLPANAQTDQQRKFPLSSAANDALKPAKDAQVFVLIKYSLE
jgi:hypothetical protein